MTTATYERGDPVRAKGFPGTYRVHGLAPDGSYTIWGGRRHHLSFRNALPEVLTRIRKLSAAPPRIPEMAPHRGRKAGKR